MTGPLLRLAHEVLGSPEVRFVPDLDRAAIDRAVLTSHAGVDPFVGERVLAVGAEPTAAPDAPFAGFLLTSQRLVVGATSLRLEHVLGARQTGPGAFEILTPRGPVALAAILAARLVAFVHRLMVVHPAARAEPPRPLAPAGPSDPLGFLVEMNTPGVDPRVLAIFGLLSSAVDQTRTMPIDGARDLAQRAVVASRRLRDGRGMVDGWWVSSLPVADLVGALARVFGAPVEAYREDARGTERLVFLARGSLIVGGTDGLDLEIPPRIASLPATPVELRVADLRGFATYQVRARSSDPLALADAPAFVHDALTTLEPRLLALRALFAWTMPADRLLDAPADAIRAKQQAMAPMADLSKVLPRAERPQALTDLFERARKAAEAELAKSPAQRKDEARARFAAALASGDRKAMWDAALKLQHAQAYAEAEAAYDELGRRFPAELGDALRSKGDAALFSVLYAGRPAAEEHVPALERAVSLYLSALRHGKRADDLDENLWEAARALSRVHPDPGRRVSAVELYVTTCPAGRNLPDADARMRELARG